MPLGMYNRILPQYAKKSKSKTCKFFENAKSAGAFQNFRAFLQSFMEFVHALSAKM